MEETRGDVVQRRRSEKEREREREVPQGGRDPGTLRGNFYQEQRQDRNDQ